MPKGWSAEEYFSGCFGVIAGNGEKPQLIKIKVSAAQANYLRDLPLHESQQETERTDDYSIFSYYMIPTFDFEQEILRHGEDMEVLSPEPLRQRLAERINWMWQLYNKEDK